MQNLRRRMQALRVVHANRQESIEQATRSSNREDAVSEQQLDNRPHLLQKVSLVDFTYMLGQICFGTKVLKRTVHKIIKCQKYDVNVIQLIPARGYVGVGRVWLISRFEEINLTSWNVQIAIAIKSKLKKNA